MFQGNLLCHLDNLRIGWVYRFLHHLSVDIICFAGVQLEIDGVKDDYNL